MMTSGRRDGGNYPGVQDFQKVLAWQRAHAMSLQVDRLARGFPRTGHAELKSQLTRAAESIGATIAEGCGSATQREFARFLDMSIKSTSETQHHLISVRDRGLASAATCGELIDEVSQIRRMVFGLRKKVLERLD